MARRSHVLQLDDPPLTNQIWLASVEHVGDAELADQQEIIVRRMLPINHPQPTPSSARCLWSEIPQRFGIPIPRSASLSSNSVAVEFTTNTSAGCMLNNPAGCCESVTIN